MNSVKVITLLSFFALSVSAPLLAAGPLELVSRPFQSRTSTFGDSADLELSGDGKWAVYSSSGSGITTNEVGELILNVFLKNLETGETILVSKSPDANQGGGNRHSFGATMSEDGRWVVFETEADNLLDDDLNESSDVVVFDRNSGTLSPVSGTTNGVAEGMSGSASITPNARFVLFESDSTDFSSLDSNDWVDLYLLNRDSGEIQLVTVNSNGTAAASAALPQFSIGTYEGTVSGDGRYVAFVSVGTNHVGSLPAQTPAQVYLRDMEARTNLWLSRATNGAASLFVSTPVVSSNGAYVAFLSANLEGTPSPSGDGYLYLYYTQLNRRRAIPDAAGAPVLVGEFSLSENSAFIAFSASNQVYLYNILSNSTRLVSATPDGSPASGVSSSPQISDTGRYVIFTSTATNLAAGAATDIFQMYRFDAQTGEVVLLSRNVVNSGGANSDTLFPVVSGNGAVAGFMSYASNLVTNDNHALNDVFAVSTSGTNAVALVSTPLPAAFSATAAGGSAIEGQALSADGRRLVFTSLAPDLVPNDTNGVRDVFLSDLQTGVTRLISLGTDGAPLPGPSSVIGVSLDGNVIAFSSSNVVNGINTRSIFIHDAASGTSSIGNVLPSGDVSGTIGDAALSRDGRYLAFRPTTQGQINVRDLENNTTKAVIISQLTSPSQILGFSPEGKYLVARGAGSSYVVVNWRSNTVALSVSTLSLGYLTNAFSADDALFIAPIRVNAPNGMDTLQLYKLDTGTNATLVATNVWTASISADGSTIAYQSKTNSLTGEFSLFTYDVNSGTNSPMQIDGTNALFRVRGQISISADGRFVAFATTNALTGVPATGDFQDIFVYDRVLKTTTLASERLSAAEEMGGASGPLLSADGRLLSFDSAAPDLVANDRNFTGDVFFRRFGMVDLDADGLEDGWEWMHFGGLNATADADADNDGMSNRTEFRAGTNPASAESRFEAATDSAAMIDGITITAPASPGRAYQLQHRASLTDGAWQDVGDAAVAFSDEVTFEVAGPLQGSGFFRVKAVE